MKVAVIGAGASGLMAAYAAAKNGNDVAVFEKNEKCGKKIYITGKGRCNVTNNVTSDEFLNNVVHNSKFLTGAIYRFPPQDLIELLENNGLRLKVERGNRVFPCSDKASDVTKCLESLCLGLGVKFYFNSFLTEIEVLDSTVSDIVISNRSALTRYSFDKVIICTGGISYRSTGSDGDGYRFARNVGHSVSELKPSLCGLNLSGDYSGLQGLSLRNVALFAEYNGKPLKSFFGECLFTHFGISGPIVLSMSCHINRLDLKQVTLFLDLKPALDYEKLDLRLVREFSESPNKSLYNVLTSLAPSSLVSEIIKRSHLNCDRKVNSVTREERGVIISSLKHFELRVSSLRPFEEAIVTSGGVDVREVNPKTMESKLISGLYFCGEVLDVDAYTGGFNLQIAFSTGYAAGSSIT